MESPAGVWNPVRLSAMHYRHLELGAAMVDEGGWQRPATYSTADKELDGLHQGVGLCDISPVGKLYLQGRQLGPLLDRIAPGAGLASVGSVARHDFADADGSRIDRVLLCRLAEEQVMVLTAADKADAIAGALEPSLDGCAHLVEMTSGMAGMTVAGPASGETLAKLTELDLAPEAFPDLSCGWTGVALVHTLVVRADTGGQPCYQVYVPRDLGEFVWDAIMVAGHHQGMAPFGTEALRRLEAGGS